MPFGTCTRLFTYIHKLPQTRYDISVRSQYVSMTCCQVILQFRRPLGLWLAECQPDKAFHQTKHRALIV
jgi:hypothetical protein